MDSVNHFTPFSTPNTVTLNSVTPDSVSIVPEEFAPDPHKTLTQKELKNLLRQFWTVRHPTVTLCGHKLDMANQPTNNCEFCWFTFFQEHGELVQTVDEMYQQHGGDSISQMRGVKFLRNFLKFMGTLAAWKAAQEKQETNATTESGTETETPVQRAVASS